jgi:hypothetical protein
MEGPPECYLLSGNLENPQPTANPRLPLNHLALALPSEGVDVVPTPHSLYSFMMHFVVFKHVHLDSP